MYFLQEECKLGEYFIIVFLHIFANSLDYGLALIGEKCQLLLQRLA